MGELVRDDGGGERTLDEFLEVVRWGEWGVYGGARRCVVWGGGLGWGVGEVWGGRWLITGARERGG